MGISIENSVDVKLLYEQCEAVVLANNPAANTARLRAAFEFSAECHRGQNRKDGSPFVTHPVETTAIVADMGLEDDDILVAAMLHDCIEDTQATHADIAKLFGRHVANIVEGVTKLTRVNYTSKEQEQMDNLQKMLKAMAGDMRVVIIKIADRLHNMRTMEYMAEEKRKQKSLETLEVYAPIAHGLGMQKIKWELEDLSLRYLEPQTYYEISNGIAARGRERAGFLDKTVERLRAHLKSGDCEAEVYGRVKHIYSIYRKMTEQGKTFHEVLDLYAFRVVVNTIAECFHALGHVTEIYNPIPGKYKDYITVPKPNGYQSLHTTVHSGEGFPFEVQIRTKEMHAAAEKGIAAHWKYKSDGTAVSNDNRYAWVRRLIESHEGADPEDFMHALHTDLFADEVFVFTPKGDVKCLPVGSTPIDFAYAVHSQVGNRMTGAIVNGRIVPYAHQLHNGDIVEVLTSNSSKGPSRDWLNIIKSPEARNKIRQWFKKEKREENIVHGKASFEAELHRAGFSLAEISTDEILAKVLKKLAFPAMDDLYAAIGYGGISSLKCVNKIRDDLIVSLRARRKETAETEREQKKTPYKKKPVRGVIIDQMGNLLVRFARCCAPVPGDPIVGFVTRGDGVSIHRGDCQNYLRSRDDHDESDRWVSASWASSPDDMYSTSLKITSRNHDGVVKDVVNILSAMKVHMVTINGRDTAAGSAVSVTVDVRDNTELNALINRLRGIEGVNEVRRAEAM